jgi:hypothetical protein
MRRLATFAVVVLLSISLVAQPKKPHEPATSTSATNRSKDAQMWMENANVLTHEIIDDGTANLPRYNDYVMDARLAEAWWRVDQKRGKLFLEQAVAIANDRKSDTPVEGFKRLFVAVTILQIITPLDHDRSEEMLDKILLQAAHLGPQAKSEEELRARAAFADLIVEVSVRSAKVSNQRRAKLYRAMLNLGGENMSVVLLRDIYDTDPRLGDQLYGETVDAAEEGRVPLRALVDVVTIAIPPSPKFGNPLPVSDSLKTRAMRDLTQSLSKSLESEPNDDNCRTVLMISTVLSSLPEDVQGRVITANEQCNAASAKRAEEAKAWEEMMNSFREGRPEDFLQKAENEPDVQKRAELQQAAAGVMAQNDAERALGILDDLSPEEKAAIPWLEVERENVEGAAIKQVYEKRDFGGLQRLIDHSPAPSKTALMIAKATMKKDPSYSASLLPTIVDRLGEGRLNDSEFYIEALDYVAKTSKPMTPVVFREAMKGINGGVEEFIRGQTPWPPKGVFKRTSFWWQLEPAKLPPLLDVMDQRSTRLTIDSLKFPMARTSMRLWLLKSELKEYTTALESEKNHPKQSQTPVKSAK